MTRCVDNEQTRDLEFESVVLVDDRSLGLEGVHREVCGTDLLSDTTSFALLDVGLADLVEKLRLTSIDVTKNTANRRTKVVLGSSGASCFLLLFALERSCLLALACEPLGDGLLFV